MKTRQQLCWKAETYYKILQNEERIRTLQKHGHYDILTVMLIIQPEESSRTDNKADGFWIDNDGWSLKISMDLGRTSLDKQIVSFLFWQIYRTNNLWKVFNKLYSPILSLGKRGRKMKNGPIVMVYNWLSNKIQNAHKFCKTHWT